MASAQDWRDLRAEFETLTSALGARDPIRADYAPPGWGHPLDRHPVQRWMLSGGGDAHAREKLERLAQAAATLLGSPPRGDSEPWLDFLRESAVDIRSGPTIASSRTDVWSLETKAPIPVQTFVLSWIDDVCAASLTACTLLATGALDVPRGVDAVVPQAPREATRPGGEAESSFGQQLTDAMKAARVSTEWLVTETAAAREPVGKRTIERLRADERNPQIGTVRALEAALTKARKGDPMRFLVPTASRPRRKPRSPRKRSQNAAKRR